MRSAVALVPARSGSTRVPGKNARPLAGHPLIAYSIAAALESAVFDAVVVSTDSAELSEVAREYGAEAPWLRPVGLATATSPDIDWVRHALEALAADGREYELFSILRPTSPFRSADSIRAAHAALLGADADSLRAVRHCREHPGKMWLIEGGRLRPLLDQPSGEVPLHSRQFATLPEVYVQDSSLEIAWTRVVRRDGSISGSRILPFVAPGHEGFSIDYPDDWVRAEALVASGEAPLPAISARVTGRG